jgi:hypothetical protein
MARAIPENPLPISFAGRAFLEGVDFPKVPE